MTNPQNRVPQVQSRTAGPGAMATTTTSVQDFSLGRTQCAGAFMTAMKGAPGYSRGPCDRLIRNPFDALVQQQAVQCLAAAESVKWRNRKHNIGNGCRDGGRRGGGFDPDLDPLNQLRNCCPLYANGTRGPGGGLDGANGCRLYDRSERRLDGTSKSDAMRWPSVLWTTQSQSSTWIPSINFLRPCINIAPRNKWRSA
jgi:hypothetical protein